jgi:hypothetical protein
VRVDAFRLVLSFWPSVLGRALLLFECIAAADACLTALLSELALNARISTLLLLASAHAALLSTFHSARPQIGSGRPCEPDPLPLHGRQQHRFQSTCDNVALRPSKSIPSSPPSSLCVRSPCLALRVLRPLALAYRRVACLTETFRCEFFCAAGPTVSLVSSAPCAGERLRSARLAAAPGPVYLRRRQGRR